MIVNGKTVKLEKSVTLAKFLENGEYRVGAVAVELNGEIISRPQYEETFLRDEDTMEIVQFVGGG